MLVEPVDHLPDPVLGRRHQPGDHRHRVPPAEAMHHHRPPPLHDRLSRLPATTPHDLLQLAALLIGQPTDPHRFRHPPIKTGPPPKWWTRPPTFMDRALDDGTQQVRSSSSFAGNPLIGAPPGRTDLARHRPEETDGRRTPLATDSARPTIRACFGRRSTRGCETRLGRWRRRSPSCTASRRSPATPRRPTRRPVSPRNGRDWPRSNRSHRQAGTRPSPASRAGCSTPGARAGRTCTSTAGR